MFMRSHNEELFSMRIKTNYEENEKYCYKFQSGKVKAKHS